MKIKKFIVFCCLLILFIIVFGFTSNLQTRAMSYNDNDIIYTKYSFNVELTLDTGDTVEFYVPDRFDSNCQNYQIRNNYEGGYLYINFDKFVVDNYILLEIYEGRFNLTGKTYYFGGSDVVAYKLFFDDILIVFNGFNNQSGFSFDERQIKTYQYNVAYSAYYKLYNYRDNPDEGLELQYYSFEDEVGSSLTGTPIFQSSKYSALVNTYGFIPVSSLEIDVVNDTSTKSFELMIPIVEPDYTDNLIVYENVYNSLALFVDRSVYGFFPLDSDVNFTSWISTAVSGFLTPEIIPGVSIGGILIVCIAIPLLLAFLKFFAGG